MAHKKDAKIIEEIDKTAKIETIDEAKEELKEEPKIVEKPKKKSKRWIIILILLIVALSSTIYWYKEIYSSKGKPVIKETTFNNVKYKYYEYETDKNIEVLKDTYLLETKNNTLYKVIDMNGTEIFNGTQEYTDILLGTNNELYIIKDEYVENENYIEINTISEGKIKNETTLSNPGLTYYPILTNEEYLVGYVANIPDNIEFDEEINTKLYIVGKDTIEIEGYNITGDKLVDDKTYYVTNEKYLVAEKESKYGIYNIEENKMVIDSNYSNIYTTTKDQFVAIKNNKAGIIDLNLKKILDFEYDFINESNDHYIVSKNNKMAIMNDEYKTITDYIFDYQGTPYAYDSIHSFESYKINDKYLLFTNNKKVSEDISYKTNEAYIVNEYGEITTIKEDNYFVNLDTKLIYTYLEETNKYTIINENLEVQTELDLSNYDYEIMPNIELLNETLIVENKAYFEYKDAKNRDTIRNNDLKEGDIEIKYSGNNNMVSLIIKNKELGSYKLNTNKLYQLKEDGTIYYIDKDKFISITKSE